MSLETMTKLASVTVGVGGQASINFTNIPQNYTDLVIKISSRTNNANAAEALTLTINGTNGTSRYLFNGSGTIGSATDTVIFGGNSTGAGATASIFSSSEVYISNYSGNVYKSIGVEYASENNNNSNVTQIINAGLWSNPSPINSLTFTPFSGSTLQQHSTATLYGVKNARQTAGNSVKATGGNIVFDGTYVTHTFNSSGSFTPTQPLLVDYLVVAGGGGGSYLGGGGGGGYRTSVGGTPMSISSNISYTVTVGAGGATAGAENAFSGTNSSFNSIASTGGGGGGGIFTSGPSGSGGSSGGASSKAFGAGSNTLGTANLGGYSPVEGYVGGSGTTSTSGSLSGGGGGGGAGGEGGAGSSSQGGSGGVGLDFTTAGVITGYSGGGGGGAGTDTGGLNSTATHGGAPGAFRDSTINTTAIANRGGGGGGGGSSGGGNAGAGGSGIVIIRYKG